MQLPTLAQLEKIEDDEFYDYVRDLTKLWHEARIRKGINKMCDATARDPTAVSEFFFGEKDMSQSGQNICRGTVTKTKKRCHRLTKGGTDYCGYHQGQANQSVTNRPTITLENYAQKRRPPPIRNVSTSYLDVIM